MMNNQSFTARGTIGGTLMIVLANITAGELVKTAILAAVGAVVSLLVSIIVRRWIKP